jgi:hypothetical protein
MKGAPDDRDLQDVLKLQGLSRPPSLSEDTPTHTTSYTRCGRMPAHDKLIARRRRSTAMQRNHDARQKNEAFQ